MDNLKIKHMELAVYGKGGIGKSTISANITAACALKGLKMLQIGCDPKHDSTLLLMHGEKIPTVLDVLRDKGKENAKTEDILREGFLGTGCIEAGGPKPGVGCAGRGIISSFEFLDKYDIRDNYDRVIFDVLGDVVCGGFAVPVRREYADAIFIVTSGEFMALYAANNILKGIQNFDFDIHKRVAGIIYNERKLEDEDGRVKRFADAVGLPILAKVPRSEAFAAAERKKVTAVELEEAVAEREVFSKLAQLVIDGPTLYKACPLDDDELENVILGNVEIKKPEKEVKEEVKAEESIEEEVILEKKPTLNRAPLYGCAFNGAASTAVHLTDAIVIAHGPKACAFYTMQTITSPGKKNIFNRGVMTPASIVPNFVSTDIKHEEAVFGGMDLLRESVKKALSQKPGAVIVVSTCVSGIIGDDLMSIEDMSTEDIPVIAIAADGDIAGDYMTGIEMVFKTLLNKLVDRNAPVKEYSVNIIGETAIATNSSSNFAVMERLLSEMGISINARFLGNSTAKEVRELLSAPLNILASDTGDAYMLKSFLEAEYGCKFLDAALPIGLEATKKWVYGIAAFFGKEEEAKKLLEKEEMEYEKEIAKVSRRLNGKKLVLSTINSNIDWLLDSVKKAGIDVPYIGVFNYLHTPIVVSAHPEDFKCIEESSGILRLQEVVEKEKPDILLGSTTLANESKMVTDNLPMIPDLGVMSSVKLMNRWIRLMDTNRKGAWEHDRALFEKYNS